jgi:tetratricopeptide (TPR) repeat protein
VPDYLDWDETGGYVDAAYDSIASIEVLLEHGWAASAVELTEHALRLLEEAVETVDQNGEMTGVLDTAQELHLRACRDAHPDPVALAERLTRWAIDGEWGVFADATDLYADLYGETGLARCREIVHDAWSELPALAPGAPGGHSTSRETVTRLRLAFADTPEEKVEILSRDLSTDGRYITVAAVLTGAGRFDEALKWLAEAQAAFPDRRDATVEEAVADTLRSADRHQEAAEPEWTAYQRHPGLAAFRRLSTRLGPLPSWPALRTQALAALEHPAAPASWPETPFAARHGNSDLVEVLLWDGDTDAAWTAAQRGGCDAPIWLHLATARAATHPADAIPILTRVIDTARAASRHRKDYAAVAAQLAKLRTWHHQAGTDTEFAAYLQRIRASNRGRPAFLDELDKAHLP